MGPIQQNPILRSLIDILDRAYQAGRHRDLLVALWEQERWFGTHHQRVAAEIERDTLTKAGLARAETGAAAAASLDAAFDACVEAGTMVRR